MKEFKFVMNDYENVCYVFVDINMPPIDTLHLIESKGRVTGNLIKRWMSQSISAKSRLGYYNTNLDKVKEIYNTYYDIIVDELNKSYLKDTLELPDKITGFYLHSGLNEISKVGQASNENRFGIVYSEEQAKGMAAFCEASQILPIYNEGWEPDWSTTDDKWFIQTINNKLKVYCTFEFHRFLVFETEEKARLFLKEKIDLITNLSKAGII
jgi:hypothetical protein